MPKEIRYNNSKASKRIDLHQLKGPLQVKDPNQAAKEEMMVQVSTIQFYKIIDKSIN
jgi:hypothetical protein